MGPATDLDLTAATIAKLTSADALATFFTSLRYRTDVRKPMSAEAIGLAGDAAAPIRAIELMAEDEDGFMRVVLVHLKSLTAKSRTDLTRVLGRTNVDHLLVLTSDFSTLEFVLLDKRRQSVTAWEQAVQLAMSAVPADADCWPDAIHDGLAVAGKEMTRLGEWRQTLTIEFAEWLVEEFAIDEDRFSGMTYLRGDQADFDRRDWQWLVELLHRNRRACGNGPDGILPGMEKRFHKTVAELTAARERFESLDAAIDRTVLQLLGLNPDGSLPTTAS